jgi:hypothetical protein
MLNLQVTYSKQETPEEQARQKEEDRAKREQANKDFKVEVLIDNTMGHDVYENNLRTEDMALQEMEKIAERENKAAETLDIKGKLRTGMREIKTGMTQ